MKAILLTQKGKIWEKVDETEITRDQMTKEYPAVITRGGDTFVYSHDELVGDPKTRGRYYKQTSVATMPEPKPTLKTGSETESKKSSKKADSGDSKND